jgi:integrase
MADIRKRTGNKGVTYQVRYADPGAKSGYAYETFATRKEALAFGDGSAQRRVNGNRSTEIRSVADGLQKWLDVCEKEGRDGRDPVTSYTLKNYEWRRDLILSYGWSKPLRTLASPDIVEFRSWLLLQFSRDVAGKLLSSFHSMILEMMKRGIIDNDVVAGVSIRTESRYDRPVVIPTEAEIYALPSAADRLANAKSPRDRRIWQRNRAMLYLAADTGMRPQEYVALPRSNVFDGGIEVDRALERGGHRISVTKTPAGRRFIDVSPETIAMVRRYAADFAVEGQHDLVFPTASGHWQSTDNWRKQAFSVACLEAGLTIKVVADDGTLVEKPKFSPYDLRHFYASMLIEQRTNLKRIQQLMGHEKIETTLNVYGHLIERVEAAAEKRTGMLASLGRFSCGESVAPISERAEMPA